MIPRYLLNKLSKININSYIELIKHDYNLVFKWLKHKEISVSYNALFDLYCIYNNLLLNSLTEEEKEEIILKFKQSKPSYQPLPINIIKDYLEEAKISAKIAQDNNEIPIGAIIVKDEQIIARGYNQTKFYNNITCHAEIIALNKAQILLQNHRLNDCDLYVTIEPCIMCVGAIIHSRIRRVIFGALEPKTGAIFSQFTVLNNLAVNHQTEGIGPIDNDYYSQQICSFLREKR